MKGLALILALSALVAVLVAMGGCATTQTPEPIVRTVEVRVPVAVPCAADPGPAPAYPDTPSALRGAVDLFERTKLLLAGRELRIAREAKLTAALRGCSP